MGLKPGSTPELTFLTQIRHDIRDKMQGESIALNFDLLSSSFSNFRLKKFGMSTSLFPRSITRFSLGLALIIATPVPQD